MKILAELRRFFDFCKTYDEKYDGACLWDCRQRQLSERHAWKNSSPGDLNMSQQRRY